MWTTEPPTEEGFYWAKGHWWSAVLVRVEESNGRLVAIEMNRMDLYPHELDRFVEWSGPILPPELPTKEY